MSTRLLAEIGPDADEETRLLIRRFFRFVSEQDVAGMATADLLDMVRSVRDLADTRDPGQARISVTVDQSGSSVLAITVTDDMPFLVDSVSGALIDAGRSVQLVMHPQLVVVRGADGHLVDVLDLDVDEPRPDGAQPESWMCVRLERNFMHEDHQDLEDRLARVLRDVRDAVADWRPMLERAEEIADALSSVPPADVDPAEVREAVELLNWMCHDNFTFLGYREYALQQVDGDTALVPVADSGLGILRLHGEDVPLHSRSFASLPAEVRENARVPHVLVLTKANSRATVHRTAYLDYVGIKQFDVNGTVVGERRFLGLFGASMYSSSVLEVPVVRDRVQQVADRLGLVPGSHSARALRQFFEEYPRDELFQAHVDWLTDIAEHVMHMRERRQTRLYVRPDDYGRFVSCLVYLPRDRYTTDVRLDISELLREAYAGESVEYTALVTESVLARLHYIVHVPAGAPIPDVDVSALQGRLARAATSWDDEFTAAVVAEVGEVQARTVLAEFADAFPDGYKEEWTPVDAVRHALTIRGLDGGELVVQWSDESERLAGLTVISTGAALSLSRVLPMLQHLGFEVLAEHPFEIAPEGRDDVWILKFALALPAGAIPDAQTLNERVTEAFRSVWLGTCESDGFNALVLRAGFTWQQAAVVRAYAQFARQLGSSFGLDYIQEVLAANIPIVQRFRDLFLARLAPDADGDREAEEIQRAIRIELDQVASLDHDRILRSLLALVLATVRTNAFARRSGDRQALAFKLHTRLIPDAPLPRPKFEIWVSSPRVQGVHLRFGMVARGGLRWSDRREDFRTEILGLVKAQEVKNAVIVPVGAKGGFFATQLPDPAVDRDGWLAEGKAAYREFVSALLDLTDNLVDGAIVPPEGVVRRDGDDPYLVVAADKGTATFSDLANAIAAEHGFWLGDAFASGGSAGYDHKAMGITARGAWVSVQRHFRELGVDVQRDDITVVGVGDMSGDVFGNGMLLSEHIRLVAAFDHRHVFIDPSPDAARSFVERRRLFDLPRSSWADYDPTLISAGGGVFPRSLKSVPLSDEARAVLGIGPERASLTPDDVVRAILQAPVDLLWNGGIGTYVKAAVQTNGDVGDRANDHVRVNGRDLRCRVVGEGGNLGFTQLGRIEAAEHGIRLNTDAIDNSAGVDTSDHEVNIKILLQPLVRSGALSEEGRLALLAEMTDEVATHVLADNYGQNVVLGVARAGAVPMLSVHQRMIRELEKDGTLDRALEYLPDDGEIEVRLQEGRGLTSPELSVLLAYSKIWLTNALDDSDLADDPWFAVMLRRYFPRVLSERYADEMDRHRLRAEIINTVVCNHILNIGGITFVFRAMEENGASAADVVRAATVALEVFALQDVWDSINALDGQVPSQTQDAMHLEARRLLDRGTRWVLQTRGEAIDVAEQVKWVGPVVRDWAARIPDVMIGAEADSFEQLAQRYRDAGAPDGLARLVASLLDVYALLDIAEVVARTGEDATTIIPLYYAVSDRYDVDRTLVRITALPRGDRWAVQARHALRSDLYAALAQLTARISRSTSQDDAASVRIDAWEQAHAAGLSRAKATLAEVDALEHSDLATLSVVLRVMRNLVTQSATTDRT